MTPAAETATPDVHATWSALVDVYQAVVRPVVARLEAETGLDSGEYSALAYLDRAEHSGRLDLGDLGALMAVRYSQSGLSRLVQRMEASGLVERRPHPQDRRATIVVTTRSGRSRFRRAQAIYARAVDDEFGARLGAHEHRTLLALCRRALTGSELDDA